MDFREKFLVPPGSKIKLADIDPAFTAKHASHETAIVCTENLIRID